MLVHYPHDLACIHCRTTAQCDDHIRLECSHSLSTLNGICQGRIRLYIGKALVHNAHLIQLVSNRFCIAIHVQEGVSYDKCSLLAHNILQLT